MIYAATGKHGNKTGATPEEARAAYKAAHGVDADAVHKARVVIPATESRPALISIGLRVE